MIIVMKSGVGREAVDAVSDKLTELGYQIHPIFGVEKTILGAVGDPRLDKVEAADQIRGYAGVDDIIFISKPYKFVAQESKPNKTIIAIGDVLIGGDEVIMMAGPCTVESEEQLFTTAKAVAASGAKILRGGAYKPSTSPYSFQGMGLEGLKLLRQAADQYGLKVVTEVMHVRKVDEVSKYADILQIGTRNMQNYDLLNEVGQTRMPAMLKRGMTSKFEEWLLAAEYMANKGNEQIIFCERGIRTFEPFTRNTLDLSAVPLMKVLTHLPVVVDPSQGVGRRELVPQMCFASVAAGCDGLLVEVHPDPDHAIKDGAQSITIPTYEQMIPTLARVAEAIGRKMASTAN